MTDWQPLSQRYGGDAFYDDGPYEGAPPHLKAALLAWLRIAVLDRTKNTWRTSLMKKLALRFRLEHFPHDRAASVVSQAFFDEASSDEDLLLDLIDAVLHESGSWSAPTAALRELLYDGGSVWTVAAGGRALERVIDPVAAEAAQAAMTPADDASAELRSAWAHAFGRSPDPSDAWDHAIKAVEALLNPIVTPTNDKATLGSIISAMRAKPSKWTHVLPADRDGGVEILISMLELMWPNPDRHSTGTTRPPTDIEARAVVQTAALVVSWLRDEAIIRSEGA